MEHKKLLLHTLLFSEFPEISRNYCKANKEERQKMVDKNNKLLKKICKGQV